MPSDGKNTGGGKKEGEGGENCKKKGGGGRCAVLGENLKGRLLRGPNSWGSEKESSRSEKTKKKVAGTMDASEEDGKGFKSRSKKTTDERLKTRLNLERVKGRKENEHHF